MTFQIDDKVTVWRYDEKEGRETIKAAWRFMPADTALNPETITPEQFDSVIGLGLVFPLLETCGICAKHDLRHAIVLHGDEPYDITDIPPTIVLCPRCVERIANVAADFPL